MLPEFLPGDTDRDGDVDSADRTTQTQNFTGPLAPGEGDKTFAEGDTDDDGDVDTADSTNLISNWTGAQLASPIVLADVKLNEEIEVDNLNVDVLNIPDRMIQPEAAALQESVAILPASVTAHSLAAQTVPEPRSTVMLLLGLICLSRKRGQASILRSIRRTRKEA